MHRNSASALPRGAWKVTALKTLAALCALSALTACGGGDPVEAVDQATAQSTADESRVQAAAASPAIGALQLVSTRPGGAAATAGSSTCSISADGSLVLFASDANNLVAGDTNGTADLFLKNLHTGAVTRVNTQSSGLQLAAGGNCLGTTMTPDGRVVAFNSGDAVFAKNTQTGVLTQASPPAGSVPQVSGFFGGVLSDDGSKLVFLTLPATTYLGANQFVNVVPARLMLRDLNTGGLETLATDNGIVAQGEVVSTRFAISPDGTRVAFGSNARNLVSPRPPAGVFQVYAKVIDTAGAAPQ